jgi:hypothetical protein
MDTERKIWLQVNAEQLIAEAEAERGFTLHPAWRETALALLKVHGVDLPAINRILDTLEMFERETGRLPAKRLDLP